MKYFLPVGLIIFGFLLIGCGQKSGSAGLSRDEYRKAASALYQKELYGQSARMYEKFLTSNVIEKNEVSKVLYLTGNIYLENLNDPEKALGKYTILKALYPKETFKNQLDKKVIQCLESMGRRSDAKHLLGASTDLVPNQSDTVSGSHVVAELDGRKITLNEVETAMGPLQDAPLVQTQQIQQYVVNQMIADAARRKGLGNNKDFRLKLKFLENQLLAQENLRGELQLTPPSLNDLKYFFEANKSRYQKGKDSLVVFEKIQEQVLKDWQSEKQQEKYQQYVQQLLKSDKVRVYGAAGVTSKK